jgi:putative flippase GtrA
MIIKYYNNEITSSGDFDYIMFTDLKLNDDYINKLFKDISNNNYDGIIIDCKKNFIGKSMEILLKLSLSVKKGFLLSCANIYSRETYNFLKENNALPEDEKKSIIGNSLLFKNNFNIKILKLNSKNNNKIGLKNLLYLIFKTGTLLKYLIVGVSGVIVNEGILLLLHPSLGPYIGIIPAIEISIIYNFILNNRYTFKGKNHFINRLLRYNAFNLIGYGANLSIYYIAIYYKTDIYLADFLGIIVAFIITYTTASLFVW